jgi:hypothetical protein
MLLHNVMARGFPAGISFTGLRFGQIAITAKARLHDDFGGPRRNVSGKCQFSPFSAGRA